MPNEFPSTLKQLNRSENVDSPGFFFLLDHFDVNNGVQGFQPSGAPSLDEFTRYIVTNPYTLHSDYGTITGVGTGDIIECIQDEDRLSRGATFEVVMSAANTGDLTTFANGTIGTRVFNIDDLTSYIFNGTTWEKVQVGPEGSSSSGAGNTYYGGTGLTLTNFVTNVGQTFSIDSSSVLHVSGISLDGAITFADGFNQNHVGFGKVIVDPFSSSKEILASDYQDSDYSTLVIANSNSITFDKAISSPGSSNIPLIFGNIVVDNSTIEVDSSTGVRIKNGGVSNTKLANSSVTINAGAGLSTTNSGITLGGVGELSVKVDNSTIEINSDTLRVKASGIDTSHLANQAVDTDKIAVDAVSSGKIQDNAVGTDQLASSSVTNTKIANSAVTAAKISSNNVVKSISVSNGVEFTTGDGQDSVSIGGITAQADSSTKGVASFDSDDFNDNSAGVISLKAASGVGPSWFLTITSSDNICATSPDDGNGTIHQFTEAGDPVGGWTWNQNRIDAFGRDQTTWYQSFVSSVNNNEGVVSFILRRLSDNSTATFTLQEFLQTEIWYDCDGTRRGCETYQNFDNDNITITSFLGTGATCEVTLIEPLIGPSTRADYLYIGTTGTPTSGESSYNSLSSPGSGGGTGGAFSIKINKNDILGRDQRTKNMYWTEYVGDRSWSLTMRPKGFSGATAPKGGYTAGKAVFDINSGSYDGTNFSFQGLSHRFENDGPTAGQVVSLSFSEFSTAASTAVTGETGATGEQGQAGPTGPTGPVGDYVESFNSLTGAVDTTSLTLNVAGLSASNGISAGTVQSARYHEDVYDNGNVSGSIALSFVNGNVQTATVVGTGTNTFSLSNVPAPSGSKAGSMTLLLTDGGTGSSTVWHPSIKWPGGVEPTLTGSGVDILSFVTYNNNLYGFVGGLNFS